LHEAGALVRVHDPKALATAARVRPELRYAQSVTEACTGADLVLLATEWDQYRALDPARLLRVTRGRCVLDARHALDRDAWRSAGWRYCALGRPAAA
jgi:UDPglucose 6-dehydrogenase